jgi:hypothetical protein
LVRWRWIDIEQHIAQLNGMALATTEADGKATADEYSSAIKRHATRSSKEAAND